MRANFPRIAVLTSLLAGAVALSPPAFAEAAGKSEESVVLGCSERADLLAHLERRYGEVFSGQARRSEKGLIELYVGRTGTWTILLTRPDGVSCPLAVGSDAEKVFKRKGLSGMPI